MAQVGAQTVALGDGGAHVEHNGQPVLAMAQDSGMEWCSKYPYKSQWVLQ